MTLPRNLRENLHFLLAETHAHLALLKQYLDQPSINVASRLMERRGYVESLRHTLYDHALQRMTAEDGTKAQHQRLRSVEAIASLLERIAELCRDAVVQGSHLRQLKRLRDKAFQAMLARVDEALQQIEPALLEQDTRQALKIGKTERQLDRDYRKLLEENTRAVKKAARPADHISLILLAHRLEQMGDALLGISEAIISYCLGQQINTERFHALSASVGNLKQVGDLDSLKVVSLAQTRSGSAINAISDDDNVTHAVFKDGRKRKLKEERQRVEDWHEILPGLAPQILSYQKSGDSASLLIEHLVGETFEQILLHGSDPMLAQALDQLTRTLKRIWRETRSDKPVSADYTGQLGKRLPDVYAIHPEFQTPACAIGGLKLPAFDQLQSRLKRLEKGLKAPYSVYIHGDFNVDNIIYDPGEKRINFIDLHRSRHMDYLQDVSVFLVSCYRLQVFDPQVRRRIQSLCLDFYRFVRAYAQKQKDESFEIRLTLGLIRSLVTSTRYILDRSLSRAMFNRAVFLSERLLEAQERKKKYKTPIQEVFVG